MNNNGNAEPASIDSVRARAGYEAWVKYRKGKGLSLNHWEKKTLPAEPVASNAMPDDQITIIRESLVGEPGNEYLVKNGYVRGILGRLDAEVAARKAAENQLAASEARTSMIRQRLLDTETRMSTLHDVGAWVRFTRELAAEFADTGPAKVEPFELPDPGGAGGTEEGAGEMRGTEVASDADVIGYQALIDQYAPQDFGFTFGTMQTVLNRLYFEITERIKLEDQQKKGDGA